MAGIPYLCVSLAATLPLNFHRLQSEDKQVDARKLYRKIAQLFTAPEYCRVYCSFLGGIRGGRSGANDTPSPARGAALNAPVEGSPPDVSMTMFGMMYSRTD